MTTNHQETQQERDYWQLWEETTEVLSEAGLTVISEAKNASYGDNLVHNYAYQAEEYEEAMEKMRHAAAEVTDGDHELLTRLWLAALAAAASINPDDDSPGARYRSRRGYYHWYYRMISGMVQETLEGRRTAEQRQRAEERGPDDFEDLPF